MEDTEIRRAFVKRLNEACAAASDRVPGLQHGRYVALAKETGLSEEAIRKWFAEIALPGRVNMRKLAQFLRVDELWLAHGRRPDMDRTDTAAFARQVEGVVMIVAGLVAVSGGSIAWPGETDPRRTLVDFYTILKGRQHAVRVCLAREKAKDRFEIDTPSELDGLTLIGAVPTARSGLYDYLRLPLDTVRQSKNRRTGGYTVALSRTAAGYKTGAYTWPPLRSFEDL